MLREVVCQVVDPSLPVNDELALVDAVSDPVKPHVNRFLEQLTKPLCLSMGPLYVRSVNATSFLQRRHLQEPYSRTTMVTAVAVALFVDLTSTWR